MSETEQRTPFATLGYKPVGAIVHKLLARYLRRQRKNMRRVFESRGLYVLADRMNQIRRSRQGMYAKNLMFQKVLNEYAALSTPNSVQSVPGSPVAIESAPVIADETEDQ